MNVYQIIVSDFDTFIGIPTQSVQSAVFIFANADDLGFFFIGVKYGNISDADNFLRIDKQYRTGRQQAAQAACAQIERIGIFLVVKMRGR